MIRIPPPPESSKKDVDQWGNIHPPENEKAVKIPEWSPRLREEGTAWCFTKLYPTYEDYKRIYRYSDSYSLLSFCLEWAPAVGVHIQGYMEFRNPVAYARMRNCYPKFYVALAKWDAERNVRYTKKGGGPVMSLFSNAHLTKDDFGTILRDTGPTK